MQWSDEARGREKSEGTEGGSGTEGAREGWGLPG